ncbi:uncharacterized protein CDAR_493191 [Caerostris darwini]|uniref:Transposase n=1 Tax=Caerostris darwini TaxID=1538125 RepID=A0AAV4TNQ8_9ARAC|nr:uncharacterized protein CDAR_493191 [Caerostris darwini]
MCRRCHQWAETLPHVLNHCGIHSHAWQLRHNAIVERVLKAISPKALILSVNQECADTAFTAAWEAKCNKYEPLLPLYQAQGLSATVVPFLVGALGSWCPWNDKLMRMFCSKSYLNLFRNLCLGHHQMARPRFQKGREIFLIDVTCPFENRKTTFDSARTRKRTPRTPHIIPILVGALGSWDPQNDSFLRRFMSCSYLNTFRKLCVSDSIKLSRDIYIDFLTAHKQYSTSEDTCNDPSDLADIPSSIENQFVSPV